MKKDSEVLEGEMVGKLPEKKTRSRHRAPPAFNLFAIPLFARLRRNCLLAAASFIILLALAIYLGNGWLFLLALLLPPWLLGLRN